MVNYEEVMLVGMDHGQTWFKVVIPGSGRICWIPVVGLNRDSFSKANVPVIENPTPPGTIYYGYKYAVCTTGWKLFSSQYVQCTVIPTCHLSYPQRSSGFTSSDAALSSCRKTSSNYCITTIPYTFEAIKPAATSYKCNVPRVDHSPTDLNYVLYWLKVQ
jgi:hypothetical protein